MYTKFLIQFVEVTKSSLQETFMKLNPDTFSCFVAAEFTTRLRKATKFIHFPESMIYLAFNSNYYSLCHNTEGRFKLHISFKMLSPTSFLSFMIQIVQSFF